MDVSTAQLVEAPVTDSSAAYETLAYVEAYDAVLDLDYAFVAYKETASASGQWRVRIKASQTAGAVFEPSLILAQSRSIGAQGRLSFPWGYGFDPTTGDPRHVQFRVHVRDGQPSEIEMRVQLRKVDHSADEAKSVRFAWPAA